MMAAMLAVEAGPILLIVGAVLLVPVIFAGGLVVAAIVGWALNDYARASQLQYGEIPALEQKLKDMEAKPAESSDEPGREKEAAHPAG